MKRKGQITGIVLAIMIVCSINVSAQGRGRGEGNFSNRQNFKPDTAYVNIRGMERMHRGMPGRGFGPEGRRGFNPPAGRQAPVVHRLENLPGITDKQKKDIIDLRYKQMAEMEKFRVDMQSKIQVMKDEHHKKLLELLTEEQKKLFEAVPQKPDANAPK